MLILVAHIRPASKFLLLMCSLKNPKLYLVRNLLLRTPNNKKSVVLIFSVFGAKKILSSDGLLLFRVNKCQTVEKEN